MKLKIAKRELINKLQKINSYLETGVPHPILTGVKIVVEDNRINFITTTLEISTNCIIQGEIIEEGKIIVPCNTLLSIINKLADREITLEQNNNKLKIIQGKIKFNLGLLNIEEFPKIEEIESNKIGKGTSKDIEQVIFAAKDSVSSGNPIIYSLYFDKDKIIATDSIRLIIKKINKLVDSFILPYNTALVVKNIFDSFKIYKGKDKIIFKDKDITLQACLLDGDYVNYKNVVPKNNYKLEVDRKNLINILERSKIVQYDSTIFEITKNKLVVINDSNNASYEEEIKSDFDGDKLKIKFNPEYLLDFLNIYNNKKITLFIKDSNSPLLIKEKDIIYLFLSMEV